MGLRRYDHRHLLTLNKDGKKSNRRSKKLHEDQELNERIQRIANLIYNDETIREIEQDTQKSRIHLTNEIGSEKNFPDDLDVDGLERVNQGKTNRQLMHKDIDFPDKHSFASRASNSDGRQFLFKERTDSVNSIDEVVLMLKTKKEKQDRLMLGNELEDIRERMTRTIVDYEDFCVDPWFKMKSEKNSDWPRCNSKEEKLPINIDSFIEDYRSKCRQREEVLDQVYQALDHGSFFPVKELQISVDVAAMDQAAKEISTNLHFNQVKSKQLHILSQQLMQFMKGGERSLRLRTDDKKRMELQFRVIEQFKAAVKERKLQRENIDPWKHAAKEMVDLLHDARNEGVEYIEKVETELMDLLILYQDQSKDVERLQADIEEHVKKIDEVGSEKEKLQNENLLLRNSLVSEKECLAVANQAKKALEEVLQGLTTDMEKWTDVCSHFGIANAEELARKYSILQQEANTLKRKLNESKVLSQDKELSKASVQRCKDCEILKKSVEEFRKNVEGYKEKCKKLQDQIVSLHECLSKEETNVRELKIQIERNMIGTEQGLYKVDQRDQATMTMEDFKVLDDSNSLFSMDKNAKTGRYQDVRKVRFGNISEESIHPDTMEYLDEFNLDRTYTEEYHLETRNEWTSKFEAEDEASDNEWIDKEQKHVELENPIGEQETGMENRTEKIEMSSSCAIISDNEEEQNIDKSESNVDSQTGERIKTAKLESVDEVPNTISLIDSSKNSVPALNKESKSISENHNNESEEQSSEEKVVLLPEKEFTNMVDNIESFIQEAERSISTDNTLQVDDMPKEYSGGEGLNKHEDKTLQENHLPKEYSTDEGLDTYEDKTFLVNSMANEYSTDERLDTYEDKTPHVDPMRKKYSTDEGLDTYEKKTPQVDPIPKEYSTDEGLDKYEKKKPQVDPMPKEYSSDEGLDKYEDKTLQENHLPKEYSTDEGLDTYEDKTLEVDPMANEYSTDEGFNKHEDKALQVDLMPKEYSTVEGSNKHEDKALQVNLLPKEHSTDEGFNKHEDKALQVNLLPKEYSTDEGFNKHDDIFPSSLLRKTLASLEEENNMNNFKNMEDFPDIEVGMTTATVKDGKHIVEDKNRKSSEVKKSITSDKILKNKGQNESPTESERERLLQRKQNISRKGTQKPYTDGIQFITGNAAAKTWNPELSTVYQQGNDREDDDNARGPTKPSTLTFRSITNFEDEPGDDSFLSPESSALSINNKDIGENNEKYNDSSKTENVKSLHFDNLATSPEMFFADSQTKPGKKVKTTNHEKKHRKRISFPFPEEEKSNITCKRPHKIRSETLDHTNEIITDGDHSSDGSETRSIKRYFSTNRTNVVNLKKQSSQGHISTATGKRGIPSVNRQDPFIMKKKLIDQEFLENIFTSVDGRANVEDDEQNGEDVWSEIPYIGRPIKECPSVSNCKRDWNDLCTLVTKYQEMSGISCPCYSRDIALLTHRDSMSLQEKLKAYLQQLAVHATEVMQLMERCARMFSPGETSYIGLSGELDTVNYETKENLQHKSSPFLPRICVKEPQTQRNSGKGVSKEEKVTLPLIEDKFHRNSVSTKNVKAKESKTLSVGVKFGSEEMKSSSHGTRNHLLERITLATEKGNYQSYSIESNDKFDNLFAEGLTTREIHNILSDRSIKRRDFTSSQNLTASNFLIPTESITGSYSKYYMHSTVPDWNPTKRQRVTLPSITSTRHPTPLSIDEVHWLEKARQNISDMKATQYKNRPYSRRLMNRKGGIPLKPILLPKRQGANLQVQDLLMTKGIDSYESSTKLPSLHAPTEHTKNKINKSYTTFRRHKKKK